jgi:hypothetical protein
MRKLIIVAVSAVSCGVIGLAFQSTFAGEFSQHTNNYYQPRSVPIGQYKPLTLWSTIALSSSYYTNPQRAQAINIAYTYEGPEFTTDYQRNALWTLAKEGKISFGLKDNQTTALRVVPLSILQLSFPIADPIDLANVLARDDVKVVATAKTLLGEASTTSVVSTDRIMTTGSGGP